MDSSQQRTLVPLGLLIASVLVVLAVPHPELLLQVANYPAVHTCLELCAIVVSLMIFAVGWEARGRGARGGRTPVLVASAFLASALVDLSHVFSYGGMPDYFTSNGAEKAIAFWLSGRFFATAGLLVAVALPQGKPSSPAFARAATGSAIAMAALVHAVVFARPEWLPRTFIEGSGLTPFKIGMELILILANFAVVVKVIARRHRDAASYDSALLLAALSTAISEACFTRYGAIYDGFNFVGHLYKVVGHAFLYRGLFLSVIERPFVEARDARWLLRTIKDAIPDLLWLKDADHRYVTCNPEFERLYGVEEAALVGRTDAEFVDAELAAFFVRHDEQAAAAGRPVMNEEWLTYAADGYHGHFETVKTPVYREDGSLLGVLGLSRNITRRTEAEAEATRLANFDSLTGLANRRLLMDRLEQALRRSARDARHGAVLFLDIDNFKQLNDTLGHEVGDQLLRLVGERLAESVRASDTLARHGGDEFVVLVADLDRDPALAAVQAGDLARKLLERLRQPYQLQGHDFRTTFSLGVVTFSGHGQSGGELIRCADLAMYEAKSRGRDAFCFFEPAMQEVVTAQAQLEADLRRAIEAHEFEIFFQPQVDASGMPIGAEGLIRWRHPSRGLVGPNEFIDLAERTGLIVPIGGWVLESASARLLAWSADPALRELRLSVNVSERQLRSETFTHEVRQLLERSAAPARLLTLEITESHLVQDPDAVVAKMKELDALGVAFSLDDFGTGYSSLAYLKKMPIRELKIDGSFVRDLTIDGNDAVIAGTVLALGHSLGLQVVAEGVEAREQHDFLLDRGCRLFQGYLVARPMPLAEFEAWVRAQGAK